MEIGSEIPMAYDNFQLKKKATSSKQQKHVIQHGSFRITSFIDEIR